MANKNPKLSNLKPFKKGDDERRNMKGAPKKLPELDILLADLLGEESAEGHTASELIIRVIRAKAMKGDLKAIEMILDRAYGRPQQKLEANENIVIKVVRE